MGFAALAVIGLLLILATGRWLFQRGVRIVAPISGFLRRPVVEVLVVLVCVGGFVRYGATKGTNGVDAAASPQASIPAPAFVPLLTPIQAGAGSYGIAADVPPITNLCFSGVSRRTDETVLGIAWPMNMRFLDDCVDVFGCSCLASNEWICLAQVDVSGVRSNAVVVLPDGALPAGAMERSAFFRLFARSDADGDGLADDEEGPRISLVETVPWFDVSEGTVLCAATNCASCSFSSRMPFVASLAGTRVSEAVADVDGLIRFAGYPAGMWMSRPSSPCDMGEDLSCDGVVVAPYWTRMAVSSDAGSRIAAATVRSGGQRYFVVEYDRLTLDPAGDWTVSFQVSVPERTPAETVFVRYGNVTDGRRAPVAVGAQGPDGTFRMPYGYGSPVPCPAAGTVLAFRFNHGLSPLAADSDGDGIPDGWEVSRGFDPLYPADGGDDADGDGLDNAGEWMSGTDPRVADTDGDGMGDGWEVSFGLDPLANDAAGDLDGDGLTNLEECSLGADPTRTDTDLDGIPDATERAIGTSLDQPDTDGDGMDDGWERDHGFDPSEANDGNADPDDDPDDDPDHDGLTNAEECEHRTNPHAPDTDDDGVNDGAEVAQGSDPLDASDGGQPNSRVLVWFYFGDDSGTHSEKYRLEVTPVSGPGERPPAHSWLNTWYGVGEVKSAPLKRGWKYSVRLSWASCKRPHDGSYYPNYDYSLDWDSDEPVVEDDPDGLFAMDYFGVEYYGGWNFPVLDKEAYLYVLEPPQIAAPKAIGVNNDDDDGDGTPDWEGSGDVPGDDDLAEVTVSVFCPDGLSGTVTVTPLVGLLSATLWRDRSRTSKVESPDSFAASGGAVSRTYYLDGSNPSSAYLGERISAELRCGSAAVTNEHRFTVIERIAEPITTESRGGEVVNPCCALVGSGTPLRVSVRPESFPDSEIRWRTVSGPGAFSEATGRDATFVASGAEGAQTVVQVDCGDCPGRAPQFTLQAATMHEVKVYPCAVYNVDRDLPITTAQVNALLDEVNVIFRQVGLHFSLGAGVSNVANSVWARDGLTDISLAAQIRNIMSGTDGVEVYFIPGNGNPNEPTGSCTRNGVIVRDTAGASTLAHELGHACGLHDIYVEDGELTEGVKESWMPQDWNNGTGCRFYDPLLMQRDVIHRVLMYGRSIATKADIPSGGVYGKTKERAFGLVSVGLNGLLIYPPRSL